MTISLVASDTSVGSGSLLLTLSATEGNLQVVMFGHRSSSLTPSIDGDGWSSPYLIETEIANSSARRAIVMYWRVVPASQSAGITADFSSSTAKAGVAYEFATDTAGGTWALDSGTGRNTNDSATSEVTSLASNAVTPEHNEAVAVDTVITRHGLPEAEDSYSDSFTTGVGEATGTGAANIAAFSGYRIVDTTPASTSTTASWTTAAMATSIIGVWSVDTGAGGESYGRVTESETARALTASKAAAFGRAIETEATRGFTASKGVAFGRVTESETARALTAAKTATFGRTTETETARSFTVAKTADFSRVAEVEAARAFTAAFGQVYGRVTESEQARGFTASKTATFGRVTETETVRAFGTGGAVEPIVLPPYRETAVPDYMEAAVPAYRERAVPAYQESAS